MTLERRDVLKLGALGIAGAACSARRSSTGPIATTSSPVAPAPFVKPPDPEVAAKAAPPARGFALAFGSCNKPALPQPMWAWVRAQKPDAWLWLGDIIYADTENIERTRSLYKQQRARPEYAALVAQTRVLGIWDDHDYGKNDAGREYPKRVESQAALLDFLDEPADSPRRQRHGTYESYEFGSENERVKVILLDGRYHRDRPGAGADTLGEEQWAWFAKELGGSTAALTIVASSYQVLPEQHSNEKWANFPRARARLFELLRTSATPGVVFVSGDRHFSELSRFQDPGIGYPLHDLTSSGLTHSYSYLDDEANRHRVGRLYSKLNYGMVRVDWDRRELTLETRGSDGSVPISQTIPLSQLRRRA